MKVKMKMEDGRRKLKMEDETWKLSMEVARWKIEDGGWKLRMGVEDRG
jgi:hypothetical protein